MNLSRSLSMVALSGLIGAGAAQAAPIPEQSKIGGFNATGFGGAYGFVIGNAVAGSAGRGNFGVDFGGPALVNSITLDQFDDVGRHRPNAVEVFNQDLTSLGTINFADTQASQTVSLTTLNGGNPVKATYLIFLVRSQHTTGSGDLNFGINSYSFDGVFVGPPETHNVNIGITPTTTGALGGFDFPARTTNHILDNNANTNNGTFFVRNAGTDTLSITYGSPKDIKSIGLALDTGGSGRDIPRFITLTDSHGFSQVVTLDDEFLQYNRYVLSTPALSTTSLTITFPDGGNAANWYIGGDPNYGVVEFEAFAFLPEPASVALMAAGLLLTLRRRSR